MKIKNPDNFDIARVQNEVDFEKRIYHELCQRASGEDGGLNYEELT